MTTFRRYYRLINLRKIIGVGLVDTVVVLVSRGLHIGQVLVLIVSIILG